MACFVDVSTARTGPRTMPCHFRVMVAVMASHFLVPSAGARAGSAIVLAMLVLLMVVLASAATASRQGTMVGPPMPRMRLRARAGSRPRAISSFRRVGANHRQAGRGQEPPEQSDPGEHPARQHLSPPIRRWVTPPRGRPVDPEPRGVPLENLRRLPFLIDQISISHAAGSARGTQRSLKGLILRDLFGMTRDRFRGGKVLIP